MNNNIKKRVLSFLMALDMAVCGLSVFYGTKEIKKYAIEQNNPFNYQQIDDNPFLETYRLYKTRKFIKENDIKEIENIIDINAKQNKEFILLYNAIVENKELTLEEKIKFANYIQYFIDNDYLDYEYVWNKFLRLKLENIDNFDDYNNLGIAGTYQKDNNQILFLDDDARNVALTHETFHAEDKSGSLLDYNEYAWFIEGLTSVLNYEYFDERTDGYDIKADFIRILCEFIEPNKLLEVRATGNMEIIYEEFEKKNIDRNTVENLFSLINEYNFIKDRATNTRAFEIIIELEEKIIDMYLKINNETNIFNPILYMYIMRIDNSPYIYAPNDDEQRNIYYFNSKKINENYVPTIINFHSIKQSNESKPFYQAQKYQYYKDKVIYTIYESREDLDKKEDILNADKIVKNSQQIISIDKVKNFMYYKKKNHEIFMTNIKK